MGGSTRTCKTPAVLEFFNWRLRDAKLNTKICNSNKHNNISCSNLQHAQHPFLPNKAFIDTAEADHYAQIKAPLEQVLPSPNTDPIFLTNGTIVEAMHTGILPNLLHTSKSNKTAQICPSNNNISLISFGKLCDDDCEARINKKACTVF